MPDCPYCKKQCKSYTGLTQHMSRTKACFEAQGRSVGSSRRVDPDPPDDGKRRSKRIKIVNQNAAENESSRLTNCDRLVTESSELDVSMKEVDTDAGNMDSDDDGFPADAADAASEGHDAETEDENDDSDSEGSEEPKPPPNREKLEAFRACCRDLQGMGDFSQEKVTSVRLLDVLKRKKAALNAFPEILEWHLKETGHLTKQESLKDTRKYTHRGILLKELHKRHNVEKMKPKIKKVRLPHSKAVADIPHRDAAECIVSLLTDPRINDEDCLFHGDSPWGAPPETMTTTSDLNTGKAHLETHKSLIKKKNQVSVVVTFYVDSAVTGQFSSLPVTPLKIGLGIHKRATREKECAWRTIGWIPTIRRAKTMGKVMVKESMHVEGMDLVEEEGEGELDSDVPPVDRDDEMEEMEEKEEDEVEESEESVEDTEEKSQDFHTMTHAILEASGFLDLQRANMIFDLVCKGRCCRDSELVFVVAFVKCDTEEGDPLSGKFTARLSNVKHGCRCCHCPTSDLDGPLARHPPKPQAHMSKLAETVSLEKSTEISQQHINNAWHKVRFHQANEQGMHGATPSEKLHAILLGIFKCVRSAFFSFMGESSELAKDIDALGKACGTFLTHQSEKDFPMTNFSKGLNDGMMMGKHCRGILLIMAAIFRSSKGRQLLEKKIKFRNGKVATKERHPLNRCCGELASNDETTIVGQADKCPHANNQCCFVINWQVDLPSKINTEEWLVTHFPKEENKDWLMHACIRWKNETIKSKAITRNREIVVRKDDPPNNSNNNNSTTTTIHGNTNTNNDSDNNNLRTPSTNTEAASVVAGMLTLPTRDSSVSTLTNPVSASDSSPSHQSDDDDFADLEEDDDAELHVDDPAWIEDLLIDDIDDEEEEEDGNRPVKELLNRVK